MTPKAFFSLGAVALVSLVAAGAVHSISSPWDRDGGANSLVLPGLADRLDEVSQLRITQSSKSLTIAREDQQWVLEDRGGFPTDGGKVRQNLIGLTELTFIEAKTRKPELYPEIEVEDPTAEDAQSRGLEVLTANGETLAHMIVGKTRRRVLGAAKGGVYLRMPGEEQSWLAAGDVSISADLADWLDPRLLKLSVQAIEQLNIARGITFPLKLTRVAGANRGFVVEKLPDGMAPKSEFALQNEVRKLTTVDFDNVRPARDSSRPVARMTIVESGGLTLSFEFRDAEDGGSWIRVSAEGEGAAAEERAREVNERYSGYEVHLSPEASEEFTLKLEDVVDIEAS